MPHFSTKTYGHDLGLSCAFRQWRANHSHCQLLHGYALSFSYMFAADELDERGWVMDFGGLKPLKERLVATFDHAVVIAADDPKRADFEKLAAAGVCDLRVFAEGVGVERFAKKGFDIAQNVLDDYYLEQVAGRNLRVVYCEVAEHGANSAIYKVEE